MASPAVNTGTGATLTFGTSSYTAQLLDIQISGISREAIETSHMGSGTAPGAGKHGNRTFIPGDLSDPGEITAQVHFNPDTTIPIDAVAETITVSVPGSSVAASWAGSGFCTGFDVSIPLEDVMVATLRIKLTGNVTRTAGT